MKARLNAKGKWVRRYTIVGTRRYSGRVDYWTQDVWAETLHAIFEQPRTLVSWASALEVRIPSGEVVHCVVVNSRWCLPPEWDSRVTPEMIDRVPVAGAQTSPPTQRPAPPRGASTLPPPRPLVFPDADWRVEMLRNAQKLDQLRQRRAERRAVGETEGVDWFPGDPPHERPAPTSVPSSGKKTSR